MQGGEPLVVLDVDSAAAHRDLGITRRGDHIESLTTVHFSRAETGGDGGPCHRISLF